MNRTAQLGLPIPRRLVATKQEFVQILERRKLQNLDQHLEKSLNTIYSKMLAQKKKTSSSQTRIKKTKARVDDFEKWLMNISQPKKVFEPEIMERVKGKVDFNRIIRLSRPRYQPCPDWDPNVIAEATLKYVATDRIVSLAQPRKEKQDDVYEVPPIPFPINPEYAAVKSQGIDKLSLPRNPSQKYRKVAVDVRCAYTPVSKGALKYEASAEIKKLSKPKNDLSEAENLADVFKVKKKALKKPSKKQEKILLKMSTPIEWKVTPKFEAD